MSEEVNRKNNHVIKEDNEKRKTKEIRETLYSFLLKYKHDIVSYTHVCINGNLKGKYSIPLSKLEQFWKLYCDEVESGENYLYIAEKPKRYLPVLVDVDIKVEELDKSESPIKKIYKKSQIKQLVEIYQSVLRTIVNDCSDNNLICFVLEKKPRRIENGTKTYIKNGFHLHFPYTFLSVEDQEDHLLSRIREMVKENNIFESLGITDSSKLIDGSYLKNTPWLMYGSRKEETPYIYSLSYILNESCEEITLKKALSKYVIYDKDEQPFNIKPNYDYYLPRVLSIVPMCRKISSLVPDLEFPLRKTLRKLTPNTKNKKGFKDLSIEELLARAKELIDLISTERADDRNDWIRIGWTLFNIGEGCEEALDIWDKFSKKSDKYDDNVCVRLWGRMTQKNLSIATLAFYAKTDNPEAYYKLMKLRAFVHLKEAIHNSKAHNDMAKVLFEMYGSEFKCASISKKIWYKYESHHWRRDDDGISLQMKLSNEIVIQLKEELDKVNNDLVKCSEEERILIQQKSKLVVNIISLLKSTPYKKNVMKECAEVFYDEYFAKNLDKDRYLIGFKNGVYDLKRNKFRNGIPEDNITIQMPIDYMEFTETDPKVISVHEFFDKIFPDRSIREYFFNVYCDVFVGGNQQKRVLFWTGCSDNGKSKVEELFEKMLGAYCIKLPTSLICGKKTQSSSATPELERLKGVRLAFAQEPDRKDSINTGMLKELSGNDTMYVRGLFKDGEEIEPMYKFAFICNNLPSAPYDDKGFWNRARVLLFESVFCHDPPETYEEQLREKRFLIDPNISEKFPDMVQAFAWILLEHRKKVIPNFSEPEKVIAATHNYRIKNDLYKQYIEECIGTKSKSILSLTELYVSFREWFKESLPGKSCPIKADVKEYFITLWGEPETGVKWKGYYIRNVDENNTKLIKTDDSV